MKPETDSNVMSWCQCGCPEVSLAWADCLSLIVCDVVFCVYVCVCVHVCRCLCPVSVSAVCLRCRAPESRGLCWILLLYPRSTQNLDPTLSFVLLELAPVYTLAGFFYLFIYFNPRFKSHFSLSLLLTGV